MDALIRGFLLAAVLSLFSNIAIAANVHGNIYDLSLNKVSGARVVVNTTPEQFMVSKDGSYSFDAPNGFYAIRAELRQDGTVASESRNISISQEGKYVIDLILFPSFDEEDDISREPELSFPETENGSFTPFIIILFLVILAIVIFVIFKGKKESMKGSGEGSGENVHTEEKEKDKKEDDSDLDKVIEVIKKEGGRTTQKEIRKQIPVSEAKISLMIAELEHKGIIRKIKKGRGNIIVLEKK
ncbi:hypothetical protein HYU50_02255 [Candidatus Woesearchaeota archaeon]|nr:hypothetical protein [Candidatus Woesearchaeota archaeon]